jgi:hypothetical protein
VENAEYHLTFEGILSLLADAESLRSLRTLTLHNVELSAEQTAALAAARPYMSLEQ